MLDREINHPVVPILISSHFLHRLKAQQAGEGREQKRRRLAQTTLQEVT